MSSLENAFRHYYTEPEHETGDDDIRDHISDWRDTDMADRADTYRKGETT